MGGSFYDGDVAARTRTSSSSDFLEHAERMRAAPIKERKCHASMDPLGKIRECRDNEEHPTTTPIALALDLTESRGEDTRVVFAKMPMFIGQIIQNGYAPHPEVCIAGCGDATCDRASAQVGQFESDNRIDRDLKNIWPEKGGGGTGQESYQNMAYFFARKVELDCLKRGKKGILVFLGDEGFYPVVSRKEVKDIFGDEIQKDIPSGQIFKELQKKFNVFFVFPRKGWEARKGDIDAEIKQRVERAGGLVEGVDIRFSLVWNNYNDLDLHVQTPQGHHIYYGSKTASNGALDVDMNVRGETNKPVENVRWEKGKAIPGKYRVWVENYNFHRDPSHAATPFKVEIEINGEVQHFEGETPRGATHSSSRIDVGTFNYEKRVDRDKIDDGRYDLYKDDVVIEQWASVIPREQIFLVQDAKSSIDVILGAIALTNGVRNLDGYIADVKNRPLVENGVHYQPQTPERLEDIRTALADYAALTTAVEVDVAFIPDTGTSPRLNRKGKSRRL